MQKCGKSEHWTNECPKEPPASPDINSVITCQHWRNSATEQSKDLMPVIKNNTALDIIKDITASVDKTKIFKRDQKTSILANCYK